MHNWIMAILTAGGLILAAFPTYWSYKCRHEGRLCENSSFSAPSSETLSRNQKLLERTPGQQPTIGEFRLVPRKAFFSGTRLDLVSSTPDNDDLVTDSMSIGTVDNLETFRFPNSHVFGATYSTKQNIGGLWRIAAVIVAYFETDGLTKRVFSIGCHGRSFGYTDPAVEVRNLAYDEGTKVLSFGLISNCSRPELNDKYRLDLLEPYMTSDESVSVISRGENVFVSLDSHAQPVSVETSREREKKEKDKADSEKAGLALASCRDREISRWQPDMGERTEMLFACVAIERDTLSSWSSRYQVVRVAKAESKSLVDEICGGWASIISEKGVQPPYVAIVCSTSSGMFRAQFDTASTEKSGTPSEKKPDWHAEWVEIFFGPNAQNYSMGIRCDCESLNVSRLSFDATSRRATFELDTDATRVDVEGREFSLGLASQKRETKLYAVEFDKVGRVASFGPVGN